MHDGSVKTQYGITDKKCELIQSKTTLYYNFKR